jgi:uncharacterized protein YceK
MKKIIALMLVVSLLAGCAKNLTDPATDKTYTPYGLVNQDHTRSKNVCYELSLKNVLLSIFFAGVLLVPAYVVGWAAFEPIRMKKDQEDTCGVDN